VFLGDFTPSAINLSIAYWYYPPDWWRFVASCRGMLGVEAGVLKGESHRVFPPKVPSRVRGRRL
jgi:hypothetical protein